MLPKRKSLRLPNHDYACGWYFVTICTKDKRPSLGTVVGGDAHIAPHVALSNIGSVAEMYLKRIPGIDTYVVMPNHVHFVVSITAERGPSRTPAPTNARLPAFLSAWKRLTNKKAGFPIWQRGYYDHVIRNEADYLRIWQYMDENPVRWTEDEYYFE
mgnify:CR=1 FL=1